MLNKPESRGYTFHKQPKYPDVPYTEYEARITKAQRLMSENGVDCMLLWSRQNNRYFLGFESIHWWLPSIQPAVGIIPVTGEPIIVVPEFFRGAVETLCWVRNILGQQNPHQPRNVRGLPIEVAGVVKEIGYGSKNIGLEMGPLGCTWIPRPLNDIEALKNALPDAKFVDGDKVIWGCRMIKSPLEVERIRKSVAGNRAIMSAVVEGYRPGMTEVDIARIAHLKAAGLDGSFIGDNAIGMVGHLIASPEKDFCADVMAHEGATKGKGDRIFFDFAFNYKGYMPDCSRVWQIGQITDKIKRDYELVWKGLDNAKAILKPGVKAKDIYDVMVEPLLAAGRQVSDMGGHGTGLDTHEPPSIDAWNEMLIEEGMVLSVERWLKGRNGHLGEVHCQDTHVVTDKGCEKIETLSRDIIQVSHPIL